MNNVPIDVLCFGAPSIDHVCQLSLETVAANTRDGVHWDLHPDSSFIFQRGHRISQLQVGRKWGIGKQSLPIDGKSTLTPQDLNYLVDTECRDLSWEAARTRSGAIVARDYNMRLFGPAKRSIEASLLFQSFFEQYPLHVDFAYLAGNDMPSHVYHSSLQQLNANIPNAVTPIPLTSAQWTTHQSFHFQIPDGRRTLIRYQEGQNSFDDGVISSWFSTIEPTSSQYSAIIINSIKHAHLLSSLENFVSLYSGKVVVVPTVDMYNHNSSATCSLITSRAETLICNLSDALFFISTLGSLPTDISRESISPENAASLLYPLSSARHIYVFDGVSTAGYAGSNSFLAHGEMPEKTYSFTGKSGPLENQWGVSNIWNGAILHNLFLSNSNPLEAITRATQFSLYSQSLPYGSALTKEGFSRFVAL